MCKNSTYIYFLILAIGLCILVTGCIIIPLNTYNYGSRENIKDEILNSFQIGISTKDDIFLELGEPDLVSPDGNCLTYTWEKTKLLWILAGGTGYGGTILGGTIERKYDLVLCFDGQGLLTRKDLKKEFK